jgi:sugar phosphate permease
MQKIFDFFKPLPDAPRIEDQEKIKKQYFYWRVRTFLAIYLGYCVFYFTRKNMSPALHIFSKELNVDIVQLGIISSVFYITYGAGKLVAGMMAERLNVRAFMATGLFLSSVVNLFYGNLTSIWMLSFFWGLNGLFQAAGYPPVAKSLVAWFGPTERTEKWSWWSSSHTAGTLGIGLLVGLLIKYCDWRSIFYVPGIIGIITSVYLFVSLRDKPTNVGLPPIEEYKNDKHPVQLENKQVSFWQIFKKFILKNKFVWYLSIALSCVYFVRMGTLDWATKFLYDNRGIDKVEVVWLWNLMPLFGMPGGIFAGYLATRFFKGRCAPIAIAYLLILSACIYGYYTFAGTNHMVATCFFLATIGFFVDGPQVLIGGVMISRVTVQEAVASAAGFSGFWSYILGAVGANLGGAYIVKHFGWGGMFAACGFFSLLAIIFVVLCWKKEMPKETEVTKA